MQAGFKTIGVLLLHLPDRDCILPDGFEFWWNGCAYRHKPGGHTDGMSSPQFSHLVNDAEPYGWALPAAVVHDGGYHRDLERWNGSGWEMVHLSKDECDQIFKGLLDVLAAGDPKRQAEAIAFYEAVHLAGQSSYDAGAK